MKKEATTKTTTKNATTQNTKKEGRNKTMKTTTTFDINAHNNNMIIQHADGSRETITAEEMKEKNAARYNAEKVATLRKWANNRGIANADSMRKAALVAALVEHDARPKSEKEISTIVTDVTAKVAKATREHAAAKKETPKKEKKTAAQKPKKDSTKKDTKKDVTKMKSVVTSLEEEDFRIVVAIDAANMQNEEIADALNRIKTLKLYEAKGADSMKNFVEDKCATAEEKAKGKKGKYHGFSYSTVNMYINAHNYIYSMKNTEGNTIFSTYGMHLIQALIVPCRYYEKAVRKAVEEGRVKASMSLEALKALIDAEGWKSPKKEAAEAKKPKVNAAANAEEGATASTLPKNEKNNGVSDEVAEASAAILSNFIEKAKATKEEKAAAIAALDMLMKRADI